MQYNTLKKLSPKDTGSGKDGVSTCHLVSSIECNLELWAKCTELVYEDSEK